MPTDQTCYEYLFRRNEARQRAVDAARALADALDEFGPSQLAHYTRHFLAELVVSTWTQVELEAKVKYGVEETEMALSGIDLDS